MSSHLIFQLSEIYGKLEKVSTRSELDIVQKEIDKIDKVICDIGFENMDPKAMDIYRNIMILDTKKLCDDMEGKLK